MKEEEMLPVQCLIEIRVRISTAF
uniref:Uncharacterized protein n=1 Tax=Anguilla anguilla TaxID=7936 RepID=A0A0E9XW71_ANGAN